MGIIGPIFLGGIWLLIVGSNIWRFGYTDYSRRSDCAIILGAAVSGALPSPVFEERIKHGISLYDSGKVSTLIFTGGYGESHSHSE